MSMNKTGTSSANQRAKLLSAFAVIAMVVCAFCVLAPVADVDGADTVAIPSDAKEIGDASALQTAVTSGEGNYKLTGNITVNKAVDVTTKSAIAIYLGTYTINSTSSTDGTVLDIKDSANVTLVGGKISNVANNSNAAIDVRNAKAVLTNLTIDAKGYGVASWTSGDVTINNCTITAASGAVSGNGLENTTKIAINGGNYTATNGAAVYFPSTETLVINGGKFTGKMGIEIRAGTTTIDNATITATGGLTENKTDSDGPLAYGMALAIIDHSSYAKNSDISVTVGSKVELNGANGSYDVYVGNINGQSESTGAFNTDALANAYTFTHNITLQMPGYANTFVAGQEDMRLASNIVSDVKDIGTAIASSDVAIDKDMTLELTSTPINYSNSIVLGDNTLTLANNTTSDVSITKLSVKGASNSSAVIEKVKIGAGESLVVRSGSIEISGTAVAEQDGKITINGDGVVVGDTDFNGEIVLGAKSTLTIPEGTTLKVAKITGESTSTVILNGNLIGYDKATIDNDVAVEITSTGSISGITGGVQTFDPANPQFEFKGMLTHDATVSNEQSLTGDLYIAEGYSLTIQSGGVLNLNGFGIYVEGTLVVDMNGSIKNIGTQTSEYGNQIILGKTGVIENNGIIGSGTAVTVTADVSKVKSSSALPGNIPSTYNATGSVTIKDVAGAAFSIVKSGNNYVLALTGDLNSYGMSNVYTVDAKDVILTGDVGIGQGVVFKSTKVTLSKDASLTVDGTMDNTSFTMDNGSSMVVYGTVNKITAKTGTYETADENKTGLNETTVTLTNITNIEIRVGQYNYSDNSTGTTVAKTEQRLYVNGTLGLVDDSSNKSGTMAITGTNPLVYVADDATLAVGKNMSVTGDIYVLGQIQYTDANSVSGYFGTQYAVVDSTDKTKRTYYITTFDKAFEQIGAAEKNTLTIRGNYTFDKDITLADGQKIVVTSGYYVNVDENAEVTLERGSSITGVVQTVDGVLTINAGASCPTPKEYAVMKKGTDFIQYSGLVPAINGAQPGDVIDVKMKTTVKNDMSIPGGVTVNIADGVVLTFLKNLTVEETAVLNNAGTIDMAGEKSKIFVYGTLESAEDNGTVSFTKAPVAGTNDVRSLQSTGTTALTAANYANVKSLVIGAVYTDEDNNTIVTSFAKAAAAVAAQDSPKTIDIVGDLNENADVTVATGIAVTVSGEATLGKITVEDGASVKIVGKLTAAVAGMAGADGATAESSVALNKASGITVGAYPFTSSDNVKTHYVYIYGNLKGEATVETGKVNVGYDSTNNGLTVTYDSASDKQANRLTVASGATLAVEKVNSQSMELTVGKNANNAATVIVEGTILFDESEYTDDNGVMDISGTMTVADDTEIEIAGILNLTGTLNVSVTEDAEGSATVSGVAAIGADATVTGKVVVTKYVKAYAGADLANASVVGANGTALVGTQFVINGDLFMTAYGTVNYSTVLTAEDFALPGYDTSKAKALDDGNNPKTYNWFTDADLTNGAKDAALGTDAALYFKAPALTAEVTVSVGSGISLYIDSIRYNSGDKVDLSVGQHTVSATVNPGYSGNVTIQFNGQTVTGGSITVTSDMASQAFEGKLAISATGDISADSTVVVNGDNGDSGMGLTDYLLIVLVVLIVIMAIIVAMRLMRS